MRFAAGTRLGPFELQRALGSGGMGEVYSAHDLRLDRDVAVKVLRPELAQDTDRLRRFRREAQLLAALDHPGVVTIHSIEEFDGVTFLTMQLVEGRTLEAIISPEGLPLARFFELAIPLTEALAAAHERGVIHRDLKPSNVMSTKDGRVKVLDFGLARASAVPSGTATLTDAGTIVGTLPYMSPEQISGMALDERTDVFSMGTILYELATGRRPFAGPTPMAVMSAILTANPEPASALRRSIPPELSALIAQCHRKIAAERLPSMRALHDLLHAQAGAAARSSSSAGGEPTGGRAGASIAVLPFASLSAASEDEFFADGTCDEIINALARLPDVKVAARTSSFSFRHSKEDLRIIGEKLGVRTILEGSVRRAGQRLRVTAQLVDAASGYHLWSERYDRELVDVFAIQEDIARSIASRLTATLVGGEAFVRQGTTDLEAFRLYAQGRTLVDQCTASCLQRALPCFQRAIERDLNYALAWTGLSDTLVLLEDYQVVESGTLLDAARDAVRRALELDPTLAEAHSSLGLLEILLRNGPAGIAALERAVELRPGYAQAHNWLSWIRSVLGHRAAALTAAERSIELNPLAPEPLSNLALAQIANRQFERGLQTARRSLEIQPDYETSAFYECLALYHLGLFDQAVPTLSRISVSWAPAAPACLLALCHVACGRSGDARQSVEDLRRSGNLDAAGLVHAALGERDEAIAAFRGVSRWDYWGTLALHNFFAAALAPLRDHDGYRDVLEAVSRSWNIPDPMDERTM